MSCSLVPVPTGPGGSGLQRFQLAKSHFVQMSKAPQAAVCSIGNLNVLCRPSLQLVEQAAFVTLNLAVTRLAEEPTDDEFSKLLLHYRAVQECIHPAPFHMSTSVQSVKFTGRLAKEMEVTLVTGEVGTTLSSREVAEALTPFVVSDQCLVNLKDTPGGAALGLAIVFIHSIGEDANSSMVYRVNSQRTKVVIRRKICMDRLLSLQRSVSPLESPLAGVDAERRKLLQLLTRDTYLGLRGVLLSGPPGCGKTTLIEEVRKKSILKRIVLCSNNCTNRHQTHINQILSTLG